jgi:transaldolase
MKIYIASAALDDIRWAVENGLGDGVLTTPAMLHAASPVSNARTQLEDIVRATTLPIVASVGAVNSADIYRDGKELARISDQIIVHVPLVEDAVHGMHRLNAEGIRVAASLVFSAAQALLAAKAGATIVSAQLDQLDANGQDGVNVVTEIRAVFDQHAVECDVLGMYPRNASQFTGCALAGVDAVALAPDGVRALMLHPLTDRGLDQMLTDLSRRPRSAATV